MNDVKQQLIAIETAKSDAWKCADFDFFEDAFADDYLTAGLPPRGVKTKRERSASLQWRAESFDLSDFRFVFPTATQRWLCTFPVGSSRTAISRSRKPLSTQRPFSSNRAGDWTTVWYQGTAGAGVE